MPTRELIMVLANSEKKGDKCVAGKRLTPANENRYNVHEWVRPIHPDTEEGKIPTLMTHIDGRTLRPFDIVSIAFDGPANDQNHPEDKRIVASEKWQRMGAIDRSSVNCFCDKPVALWGDGSSRRVPVGYVARMATPFTLALIQPQEPLKVEAFYEETPWGKKFRKRLTFSYCGMEHVFDITDPAFIRRHNLAQMARNGGDPIQLVPEQTQLCLSLTPPFEGHQYKIAATIIEAA